MKRFKIILFIIIILLLVTILIMFTDFGQSIRSKLHYKYGIEKEVVIIEQPKNIKVTYNYGMSDVKFEITITDEDLINNLVDSISNKKLNNETKAGIMLEIIGTYEVDLSNNIKIKFDNYSNGYIKLCNNGEEFITQINSESLKKIEDIINVKLTEDAQIFDTNKISITNIKNKQVDVIRKTAINYVLNKCKYIGTKEIDGNIINEQLHLKYKINFNNGIEIIQYDELYKSFLIKNGKQYEVFGLEVLDRFLEFAFYDSEQKDEMFRTEKIILESPNKSIEVTDKDVIEKITTPIVYSELQERDYINERDITEEYNNAIKIKINGYELLVSDNKGTFTMGDRYIIYPNKTRKMYFLLEDIEGYVNELLYKQ